jgi:hypothetical protein
MPKADDIFSKPNKFRITYGDVTLLEAEINVEALGLLCSEDIANILFEDRINFDEFVGYEKTLEGIKRLVEKPDTLGIELNPNDTPENVEDLIRTTINYILEHLPKAVIRLISEMLIEGKISWNVEHITQDKAELKKRIELIKNMAQRRGKTALRQIGVKEHARGGSKGKWTEESRAEFLSIYEDALKKAQAKSRELPSELLEKLSLRGVEPNEVALEYAAKSYGVELNEYLTTVLKDARRERRRRTMKAP